MTGEGKLRIAVWHNLLGGGGKRALYLAVKHLVAQGHGIETWCPDSAELDAWPLDEFGPRHVLPLREVRRRGPFRKHWPAYYAALDRLDTMEAHAREAGAAINAGAFDVLLANPCQFLAAPSIKKHVRCPAVLWLHEPRRVLYECSADWVWHAPEYAGLAGWSPRYLKRMLENLMGAQGAREQAREEMRNARSYARLLANSRYSRESLLRAYGCDAHICYPAVDTGIFRPSGVQRKGFVVSLGHLYPHKRPETAIRAVAAIPAALRPRLLWLGRLANEAYRHEMELLAQSLEVRFEVRVDVSDAAIVAALNEAALLLFTPRLEPFGLAPLEANACGTPVVAIAEGGVRETMVHGDNALLVEHDDPEGLARAMESLLSEPALAAAMGERGRARVEAQWTSAAMGPVLEAHLLAAIETELGNHLR